MALKKPHQGRFIIADKIKKPENCVYCQKMKANSREHLFGNWLKPYIQTPSDRTIHVTSFQRNDPFNREQISAQIGRGNLNREGAPHAANMKIVCKQCNNTWLSQIHQSAQNLLVSMINGNWHNDIKYNINSLASYATMVTMNIEFADLNTLTTPQIERTNFMNSILPPENWQIYAGFRSIVMDTGSFWHRATKGCTGYPTENDTRLQTTIFHIGKSFFYTISGSDIFLPDPELVSRSLEISPIWPTPRNFDFSNKKLGPMQVHRVATFLFEQVFGTSSDPHFGLATGPVPFK